MAEGCSVAIDRGRRTAERVVAFRSGRVLGARGRARAAVGNAVAGRQVIVIGAAVPLCRGRPSRRAHAHSRLCVASPSVSRTPLLLFTLASPFDPAPQPTLSIFAVRWVAPDVGAAPLGGGAGGGGRCTPFFFKSFSFFSRIFYAGVGMERSLLFHFILIYCDN